jgi:tetratricopeptide (TPR) repeat protein
MSDRIFDAAELSSPGDRRLDPDRLDQLWDFADPVGSAQRFRDELAGTSAVTARAELNTQLARALGLQGRFDEADAVLTEVETQGGAITVPPVVAVRTDLERGRLRNSAGRPTEAVPFFAAALTAAEVAGEEFLAVDAAHMLAIADQENAADWTRRGLALAHGAADARARRWAGALHNNLGWMLHDAGDPAGAVSEFEQAEVAYLSTGTPEQQRIARWSVARCLRTLGRIEEALSIQLALHENGPSDGYVEEELGELYLTSGEPALARPYFAAAEELLGADEWLAEHEPDRLARLRELAAAD